MGSSFPAGVSLEQHSAQQEQKLLWDVQGSALSAAVPSCPVAKGKVSSSLFCQRLLENKLVFAAAVGLQTLCPVSRDTPTPWELGLSLAVSPVGLRGHR